MCNPSTVLDSKSTGVQLRERAPNSRRVHRVPRPPCHLILWAQVKDIGRGSSVQPIRHCANLNVQVDGVAFAVGAAHARVRRDGYRAGSRSC